MQFQARPEGSFCKVRILLSEASPEESWSGIDRTVLIFNFFHINSDSHSSFPNLTDPHGIIITHVPAMGKATALIQSN